MGQTNMQLEIQYFPQTDTLYIGGPDTANEGYDIAENLIAHAKEDGEVVGVTLEHASAILAPYLRDQISSPETGEPTSVLRDEGEPI